MWHPSVFKIMYMKKYYQKWSLKKIIYIIWDSLFPRFFWGKQYQAIKSMNWIFLSFGVGAQIIGSATEKSVGLISINTHELILICSGFPSDPNAPCVIFFLRSLAMPQPRFPGGRKLLSYGLEGVALAQVRTRVVMVWSDCRLLLLLEVSLGGSTVLCGFRRRQFVVVSPVWPVSLLFLFGWWVFVVSFVSLLLLWWWWWLLLFSVVDHRCIDGPTSSVVELGLALRWLPWRVAACLFWAEGVHLEKNCWKKDMWADMLRQMGLGPQMG